MNFLRTLLLTIVLTLAAAPVLTPIAHADGGWEYIGTTDGVRVSRKTEPGSDQFSFRGETVAPIAIGKLLAVFLDRNQRKYWVDRYDDSKTLERPGPLSEIYWIKFALPFPVSNRDYVLRADGTMDAEHHVFLANIHSVNDPRKPKDDCCVRATANRTFYRFEAIKGVPEKTKIVVEVSTDPKGMLPDWLVNIIQKKWPVKTLGGLIERTRKANPAPLPDFATWHE
jgi:hypothetical protein